jgi:hypothetical protein
MVGVAGGTRATATLTVANTGSAAIFYDWQAVPSAESRLLASQSYQPGVDSEGMNSRAGTSGCNEPPNAGVAIASKAATAASLGSSEDDGAPRFYLADPSGVLLPGEAHNFLFAFSCSCAGIYSKTWAMTTIPPLPAHATRCRAGDAMQVSYCSFGCSDSSHLQRVPVGLAAGCLGAGIGFGSFRCHCTPSFHHKRRPQVELCGVAVAPEMGQAEVARQRLECSMKQCERDRQVRVRVCVGDIHAW